MSECKSCFGCKFLYGDGQGYSNWTWMDTFLICALSQSEKLKSGEVQKPYTAYEQREPLTPEREAELLNLTGPRCSFYSPGPFVELCPDRDEEYKDLCIDEDQYEAIKKSDSHNNYNN